MSRHEAERLASEIDLAAMDREERRALDTYKCKWCSGYHHCRERRNRA